MPSISGTVQGDTGLGAAGRTVRLYRRDTGLLLGSAVTSDGITEGANGEPPLPVGQYTIETSYTGECNVVCLDDTDGTLYNDLIARVTPV